MDLNLGYTGLILKECRKHGLLRNQAAYVLATAYWETARTMKPVIEAFWKSEAWRERNLRYYPWHGRGFVQLTWEKNYKRAEDKLGVSFTKNPNLAQEPKHAAAILVIGMKEGWFTGKKLSQYITLHKSDFKGARRIVNGTDRAATIANMARKYDRDLIEIGYGVVDQPEPNKHVQPKPAAEKGFFEALWDLIRKIFFK